MFALFLQLGFKTRKLEFLEKQQVINYAFYEYSNGLRQLDISPPTSDGQTYIFQHTATKITDLEIYGSFGDAKETGLVWNQPEVRVFNVLLQMQVAENSFFAVAGRALKIILFQCYFEVENAVVRADTAYTATSITQCTFAAQYILAHGIPYDTFVRSNAVFTRDGMLSNQLSEFVESCANCADARTGKGCVGCVTGTMEDDTKQCSCIYANYEYDAYLTDCQGQPIQLNSPTTSGEQMYFIECRNRVSLQLNYTFSSDYKKNISVFKDDSCSLNNVFLVAQISVRSNMEGTNALTGLTFEMTKNVSFLNLSIRLEGQNRKLIAGSLVFMYPSPQQTPYSFEHVRLVGRFDERGNNRNYTEDFHFNGLFHSANDVRMSITNVSFSGYLAYSYWDGTYCSMGIGTANNAILNIREMYFGDNYTGPNPMASLKPDELEIPFLNCSDKMGYDMMLESAIRDYVAPQLIYGYNSIDLDEGPKVAGFIGKLIGGSITMKLSLISLYAGDSYVKSVDFGIVAVDVINSSISIQQSTFTGKSQIYGGSGLITRLTGPSSLVSISASVNLSSKDSRSGIIGMVSGGIISFNVLVNFSLVGNLSGGLIGEMKGGQVSCKGAFGAVKYGAAPSNREVGLWSGGWFDDQQCENPNGCELEFPENSYINVLNKDGVCGSKVILNEPIGSPTDQFFFPCVGDKHYRVSYAGQFQNGNISLLQRNENCVLVNIKVAGSIVVQGAGGIVNISGLVHSNFFNMSNIITDIALQDDTGNANMSSLLAINITARSSNYSFNNITLRGQIKLPQQGSSYILKNIGGFTSHIQFASVMRDVALYGTQITGFYMNQCGLVIGVVRAKLTTNNLIIDDYRSDATVPNFLLTAETDVVDFPCTQSGPQDLQLGARFKNLIRFGGKKSFIKSIQETSYACGGLYGYSSGGILEYSNLSINLDTWLTAKGSLYNGGITGQMFSGDQLFTNTFIMGQTMTDWGALIGYIWDDSYFYLTIEYNYTKASNSMFGAISGAYDSELHAMVHIIMTGPSSVGFLRDSVARTIIYATGIVIKCPTCKTYYMYITPDEPKSNWNCSISNDNQCPT